MEGYFVLVEPGFPHALSPVARFFPLRGATAKAQIDLSRLDRTDDQSPIPAAFLDTVCTPGGGAARRNTLPGNAIGHPDEP
jgi:hypothetical protein